MAKINVFESIMSRNDRIAVRNKKIMGKALSLNLMSSPGAGKTRLLETTLKDLGKKMRIGVIEGDVATSNDAERIKKYAPKSAVYQIKTENYGGTCHLDAKMVSKGLAGINAANGNYNLIIFENVGNLICPADFFLGEDKKVVLLSVTEGDDKPVKYPGMFESADLIVLNKIDLLKHLKFNMKKALANIRKINKKVPILLISAEKGTGIKSWYKILNEWIIGKNILQ